MLRVLAVDLGASSIRVADVDLDATPPALDVIFRRPNAPVRLEDGSLRWDWDRIVADVVRGLEAGLERGPVASIGIDAWGVDYGLLDANGELLSPPYCYRDDRTSGWRAVADRIGADRLYRTTGIQLMQINTLFQLAAHDARELARTERLLMLPELLLHHLTTIETGERTSAGTTALVDVHTGEWSRELLDHIGIDPMIMPPIAPAATRAGEWRGVPVHLVGEHDTASAVAAMPAAAGNAAFISSGTWMLVGAELSHPDVSDAAMRANFSNEPGALGGVRFLKNVMGLWMLDQCRARWSHSTSEHLLDAAGALPAGGPTVDATDARFLAPADMEAEVRAAAGLPGTAGRDEIARCILDSLARAAAGVIGELGGFLGRPITEASVLGGGARNWLLNKLIEDACGVPVHAGPVEAAALGNALVQGVALGRFASLDDARRATDTAR